MRRFIVPVAALIALGAVALGGPDLGLSEDQMPTSPAAKGSLVKLSQAIDKANADRDAAVKKATDQTIAELEDLRATSMKLANNRGLDEANRLQAAIDALKADTGSTGKVADRPVGRWQFTLGSSTREYQFGPDGTVSAVEGGKSTPIAKLQRDGEWWGFVDSRLNRIRRLYQIDAQTIVIANHEGNSRTPASYTIATPAK